MHEAMIFMKMPVPVVVIISVVELHTDDILWNLNFLYFKLQRPASVQFTISWQLTMKKWKWAAYDRSLSPHVTCLNFMLLYLLDLPVVHVV